MGDGLTTDGSRHSQKTAAAADDFDVWAFGTISAAASAPHDRGSNGSGASKAVNEWKQKKAEQVRSCFGEECCFIG